MKQWLNQHGLALTQVIRRVMRNKTATLVMFLVMGVTISLPAILYVTIDNLNRLAVNLHTEPQISVFFKLDAAADAVSQLGNQLKKRPEVARYEFVSREAAWKNLQAESAVAGSLEHNPLPDAYIVFPKSGNPAEIQSLQQDLQQQPGVELAQLDADWVKRLYAILELGKKAIMVLMALLGFALVSIIGNTIRLQLSTQREEIEVSKLIGATNRFIRRPFLYAGMLYGLGGGLAALLLLAGVITLFNNSVADIARLYASDFRLSFPDACVALLILAIAVGLGWMGSWIAVARSLAKIDSTY